MYFADNDDETEDNDTVTCSTVSSSSSSGGTYETYDEDDGGESYVRYYPDASAIDCDMMDCDPLTAAEQFLSMPVTLGVLCVDNIFSTDFFDATMGPIPPNTKKATPRNNDNNNNNKNGSGQGYSDDWTIESIDYFREKRRENKIKQRANRGRIQQRNSNGSSSSNRGRNSDRLNTSRAHSLPSLLV